MNLYPAIDVLGGQVVRLRQGEYDDSTVYSADPVAVARSFVDAGATWIHMVDLDAARTGEPVNRAVIAAVAEAVSGRARVQVGGGVRSVADARTLANLGVDRVVMGSAAVAQPSVVADVADDVAVAVGLDHRAGIVAVHGWTADSDKTVEQMLAEFPRAAAFIITDISRDGMLVGPDLDGLRRATELTSVPVIASGGVGSLDHVRACGEVPGLDGVIVGKALYEGKFTVAVALSVVKRAGA